MVIIWTHDDRTNQTEDANKGNIRSDESSEDVNLNDKSINNLKHSNETLPKKPVFTSDNELQVNLQNVNAIVHNDDVKTQKVESCIETPTSVICNGDFKNRSSHFSYKKQNKNTVNILIHRHTL